MRAGYTNFGLDSDDRRSMFIEDGQPSWSSSSPSSSSSSSTSCPSLLSRCASACTRSNDLFWPFTAVSLLALLFFVLTIAGYSRSTTSSPSSSPIAFPTSYPLASLIGAPLIPPSSLPSLSLTLLHLNDIYELLPLANNSRGGLARVAYLRSLLLVQDPSTLTLLAGDLLSPSPLGSALVNGTQLQGAQMIDTLNLLGVDVAAYGNHEMDLTQPNLLLRVQQSAFPWLSLNTFRRDDPSQRFPSNTANPGYVIRRLNGVRLLVVSLQIDSTLGSPAPGYVTILDPPFAIALLQSTLKQLTGQYDVAVGLTHWDLASDQLLVESVPQLSLVMGGHEHADYYITRGLGFTPIAKADSNDATVYIHRLLYVPSTGAVYTQSHLQVVDASVPSDPAVLARANYWQQAGLQGYREQGFDPDATVCNLAPTVWDGRSEIVRTDARNLLTQAVCRSLLYNLTSPDPPVLAVYNTGSVRVDDILEGELTQYDVLRILPFPNYQTTLTVNASTLLALLTATGSGGNVAGSGGFLSYCGALNQTGSTWSVAGQPLTGDGAQQFVISTSDYFVTSTVLAGGSNRVQGLLMSLQLISYLTNSSCGQQ